MLEKSADNKIKVWSRQHQNVLQKLEEKGVYRVKERYIRKRLGSCADIYLDVYRWLRNQAGKRMDIAPENKFPIWLSVEESLKLPEAEGHVFFELEIPESEIMIFDELKWDYIVNYLYLPKNKEDKKRFKKKVEKYNIQVESDIYLQDFYPALKKEMTASWQRLFDQEIKLSDHQLGICWQLKKDWVVDYEIKE